MEEDLETEIGCNFKNVPTFSIQTTTFSLLSIFLRRALRQNDCKFQPLFCEQLLKKDILMHDAQESSWCDGPLSAGVPFQPYYSYLAHAFRQWAEFGEGFIGRMKTQQPFSGIEIVERPTIQHLTQAVVGFVAELCKLCTIEIALEAEAQKVNMACSVPYCRCQNFCRTPYLPYGCWCTHSFVYHGTQKLNPSTDDSKTGLESSSNELVNYLHHQLTFLLASLGEDGVLFLLGCRKTMGTLLACPPPITSLLRSFNSTHSPSSKKKAAKGGIILTVGARALSKHFHRSRDCWWGDCKGSEAEKNAKASEVVKSILSNAVWMNVHWILGEYYYEVRNGEGYGARWQYGDNFEFRGFLEPQMEDGHEKQWRH